VFFRATCAPKSTKSGYSATYLGLVSVGNNGSVRQIEEAIKRRLSMTKSDTQKPVIFEIGEMNIKVLDSETGGVSCAATGRLHKLKHQFSDRF
jgi:hypothetical protein